MDIEKRKDEMLVRQSEEIANLGTKLTVAYAFIKMLRTAYDALLHHDVNYQNLPEYKNPVDLENVTSQTNKTKAFNWLARMISGIEAATRRKGFTVH